MDSIYRVTYQMDEASGKRSRGVRKVGVSHKELDEECRHAIKEVLVGTHKNESVVLLKVVAVTGVVRSVVEQPPSWESPVRSVSRPLQEIQASSKPRPVHRPRPVRKVVSTEGEKTD